MAHGTSSWQTMQLRREELMEERKDKPEERVEDLEVRDDEARDIAGGKKKARAKAGKRAKAVGHGHGYGVTKET